MTDSIAELRQLLLEDHELRETAMQTVHLADGEILFNQGDPGETFYLIESGQIRIYTVDHQGKQMTLNRLSGGETLGELALIDARPRSASAIAEGNCTLMGLQREDFLRQLYNKPALNQCAIQLLSSRVRYTTTYIEQLGSWMRLIIDGNYESVLQRLQEIDPKSDRAVLAVADSIKQMVKAVQAREEKLRQEVVQLQIKIDHEKRKQQVQEITESDMFENVLKRAQKLRGSDRSSGST